MKDEKISFSECNRVRSRLMILITKPQVLKPEVIKEMIIHLEKCSTCSKIFRELGGIVP